MSAKVIQQLLAQAGVTVNGANPWDIRIHNENLYDRILRDRNLGLGEAYMDGWWDCERLDEFFYRLLKSNIEEKVSSDLRYLLRFLPAIVFNLQSKPRSRMIAERHYDLDNDLFLSFLDSYNRTVADILKERMIWSRPSVKNSTSFAENSILPAGIMCWISAAVGADYPDILPNTMVLR